MAGWTGSGTAPAGSAGVLIAGEETGGRFALIQTFEVRGGEPPRHRHEREDEILHVLDGTLRVWVAGAWVEAPAGTTVVLPRGVEHGFVVATDRTRLLTALSPAGFEGFYRETAGLPHPIGLDRLVATAARHGCEITGPSPSDHPSLNGRRFTRPRRRSAGL